jgi:hypothetical protein
MAEVEARKSFPTIPTSLWWTLRRRFRQSIPGVISDSYLATVLNMAEASARANVRPALRALGLIQSDGKATERVSLWRDDETYPEVCKAMVEATYPEELIHGISEPWHDQARTERWFANKTGVGENGARKMASLYTLLMEADPSKQDGEKKQGPVKKASAEGRQVVQKSATMPSKQVVAKAVAKDDDNERVKHSGLPSGPDVNINLQIHISADASPDQIEQIFASMSKHLYKNA